ncbi:MAG TPA: DegV family protein [Acidimicrobiales bacterium]|jgi:DegV family protein with EDD domain|nr:DegV family protein [Acidimicrobiales bacterium]
MAVRIVTDSSCDLSADEADQLEISIVPLTIRFGADEFTDRVDLSVGDFYRRLAESEQLPETAAPSPGAFETAFRAAADAGADAVVCINLSSDLSATLQSALTAAKAFEGTLDVRVVDSRSITLGLGSQVIAAAEAARDGRSADEIVEMVEDMASRTHVLGALDTLENLKKGGRIGGAQALLGNLLSIKPLIDVSTGRVEEAGKARTRKKALQWMASRLLEEPAVERLSIAHGEAPDLDEFLGLIASRYPRDELRIGVIGAVIGTHAGPRVMGVTWQRPPGAT